jgi:hypothetical protein
LVRVECNLESFGIYITNHQLLFIYAETLGEGKTNTYVQYVPSTQSGN